jgi:hypothetical protein
MLCRLDVEPNVEIFVESVSSNTARKAMLKTLIRRERTRPQYRPSWVACLWQFQTWEF